MAEQVKTLEDVERLNKEFLVPSQVASILGCAAYKISLIARDDPEKLGFPIIRIGNRTKIPKSAFLNYMRSGNLKEI